MVGLQNASRHDAVQQLQMKAVGALFVVGRQENGVGQRFRRARPGQVRSRSGKQAVRRHARMVVFTASCCRVVNAVGSRAATPWSCWAAELSGDRHTTMLCKVDEKAA